MRTLLMPLLAVVLSIGACGPATYPPNDRALQDAELSVRIKTALLNTPELDATKVDVRANRGAVTLAGQVPTADQAARVIELVRKVQGVVGVESKIVVAANAGTTSSVRRQPTVRF